MIPGSWRLGGHGKKTLLIKSYSPLSCTLVSDSRHIIRHIILTLTLILRASLPILLHSESYFWFSGITQISQTFGIWLTKFWKITLKKQATKCYRNTFLEVNFVLTLSIATLFYYFSLTIPNYFIVALSFAKLITFHPWSVSDQGVEFSLGISWKGY